MRINHKKFILIIIVVSIGVLLVDGYIFSIPYLNFFGFPPIQYWLTGPSNFGECIRATRGFVIKTKPPKCEYNGNLFIEGVNPLLDTN